MAVNYSLALKTARLQLVADALDAGTGPGRLEIGTAGFTSTLIALALGDPGATVSGDELSLTGMPLEAGAALGGKAAEARLVDSDGNVVVSGLTVGEANANVILSRTLFVTGQTIRITSGTIRHA